MGIVFSIKIGPSHSSKVVYLKKVIRKPALMALRPYNI